MKELWLHGNEVALRFDDDGDDVGITVFNERGKTAVSIEPDEQAQLLQWLTKLQRERARKAKA